MIGFKETTFRDLKKKCVDLYPLSTLFLTNFIDKVHLLASKQAHNRYLAWLKPLYLKILFLVSDINPGN